MTTMLENGPEVILENLESVTSTTITKDRMFSYLEDTKEFINSLNDEDCINKVAILSAPTTRQRRKETNVAKKNENILGTKYDSVNSFERFEEMLGSIKSFVVETLYNGSDSHMVKLIRGILPDTYQSRIPFVLFKDLPSEVDKRGDVFAIRETEGGEDIVSYYCTALHPFFNDKGMTYYYSDGFLREKSTTPLENLYKYHSISFKVVIHNEGENGIIQSWDVGLNKHSQGDFSNSPFVMLGQAPY